MQKEQLSALMDGETLDKELLNELSRSSEMQKTWESLSPHSRYAAWRYRRGAAIRYLRPGDGRH